MSLLRAFSQRVGIQILLREYNFDNRQRQPFYEDDIINMYPIVKHVAPKVSQSMINSLRAEKMSQLEICNVMYFIVYRRQTRTDFSLPARLRSSRDCLRRDIT